MGRYLTDTVGASIGGFIPALVDLPPHNEDGVGGMHVYVPWWLDNKNARLPARLPHRARRRAWHALLRLRSGIDQVQGGGYGKALKDDYRRYYGAFVGFSGRGEMIPNENSYCEIDPDVVDRWGIPVLRFHWKWSDDELGPGAPHAQDLHAGSSRRWAARWWSATARCVRTEAPPRLRHLASAARSSTRSAPRGWGRARAPPSLNEWCQAHDAKNVFVADAGPFVSNAHKNCTWTILALSMRTAEHIADERKRGNL